MKKVLAIALSLIACGAVLTGCSDGESSVTESGYVQDANDNDSGRYDDSDDMVDRVKDGAKSAVSGGADIVGDAASTVNDVVSDVLR